MANPANTTAAPLFEDGRQYVNVTENKTLGITDQGIVQNVVADGITITLPATVVGYSYTVRNGGVPKTNAAAGTGDDGSVQVAVSPNASDLIAGNGFTAADNKDALNTKATARVGDEVSIVGNGTTGWNITSVKGTWAREA